MFAVFAIGPLPFAGIGLIMGSLEFLTEVKVWLLTKSMGMRAISWVLAGLIFTTIVTVTFGGMIWLTWSFTILKGANPSILGLMILCVTYASYF